MDNTMHQENQSRNEDTYNSIEREEQAQDNDEPIPLINFSYFPAV